MREYLKEKVEAIYQGEIEPADLPVEVEIEETVATEEEKQEDELEAAVASIKEQIDIDMVAPTLIIEGETLQQESDESIPEEAVKAPMVSEEQELPVVEPLKVFQFDDEAAFEEVADTVPVVAPALVLEEQTESPVPSEPSVSFEKEERPDLSPREELNIFRQFNLAHFFAEQQGGVMHIKISPEHIILFLICYIFLCIPLFLIAKKTLTKTATLAFLPFINVIYMCAVGRKPLWWFFLLMLPVVQVIVFVLIWGGIAEASHKSKWMGVLMLIPLVNLILPWYLAISK